jgi:xanthine/uracil/vitamin C permease (AzgA family)
MGQQTAQTSTPQSAAAKLFDLRVLIGGLFTFYGVVLIIAGIFASAAEIEKAAGININLWMGIGMLITGLLFLLWWRLNPLHHPVPPAHEVEYGTQ